MTSTVISIVGARPQFIKAAVVSRALADADVEECVVHTGQHYDPQMSQVFFDELGIPAPAVNLEIGSGSHAVQTGEMMVALERFIEARSRPGFVLVYGDTNSTLAGALVAAKMNVPLAHVEAGLRSFNRRMPEEVNRVVTDHLSQLLFCPTQVAVDNLAREGVAAGVHLTGDVMLDATRFFAGHAADHAPLASITPHASGGYYLATIHRAENTDAPARLKSIFDGLGRLDAPVLLPLHPRTRARLDGLSVPGNVEVLEPAGYLAMLTLIRNARTVLTDSGGVQKEAYWLETPCVTLRDETEWVETLEHGWNQLCDADPDAIAAAAARRPDGPRLSFGAVPGGTASALIARLLLAA